MNLFSIGSDCCMFERLTQYKRLTPCNDINIIPSPFDNVLSDFSAVLRILEYSDPFKESDWEYICTTDDNKYAIKHKYMNFVSIHDISSDIFLYDAFCKLTHIFTYKTEQFKEFIKKHKSIMNIVSDTSNFLNTETNITEYQINIFNNLMQSKYNSQNELVIYTNNIPIKQIANCTIIHTNTVDNSNWYRDHIDWNSMFNNVYQKVMIDF